MTAKMRHPNTATLEVAMKFMKYCCLLVCIVTLTMSIGFADDDKTHPEVRPDNYEWSMWMHPSNPPGDQFENYAKVLADSLPALQLLAQSGLFAPSVDLLHAHAQLIIHVLEGRTGPNANLVPFETDTVHNLLSPLETPLDFLARTSSRASRSGIIYLRGGLLWVIDWALPQLAAYAQQEFHPLQQSYIEIAGKQIQSLMLRALDSAIASIGETDFNASAAHLLDTNAFLFAALGSPSFSVSGTGLYFLTGVILDWTWFGR